MPDINPERCRFLSPRRVIHAFITVLVIVALAGAAAAEMSPACTEDLLAVDRSFDETLARLEATAGAETPVKCAAWRHHVDVMTAGREVFRRCLAGYERSENVGQLDVSIADFLDIIAARCPRE